MNEIQRENFSRYINNNINNMFTADEYDYDISEIIEEMPTKDINNTCLVFVLTKGKIISYYLAIFKNGLWHYPKVENGLVKQELKPLYFNKDLEYLGYVISRMPTEGKIKESNISEILKSVVEKFKTTKFKEKVEDSKLVELQFKSSNGIEYRIYKGCLAKNGYMSVVSNGSYYQCKTKERLLQLIDILITNTFKQMEKDSQIIIDDILEINND